MSIALSRRRDWRRPIAHLVEFAAAAAVFGILTAAAAPGAQASAPGAYEPGRLLVKLRATPALEAAKSSGSLRAALGSALDSARPLARRARGPLAAGVDRIVLVDVDPQADVPALARKLGRLPEVEYAEPLWIREIVAVPNDPAYTGGQQAYLAALQVELAWDVQKSGDAVPRPVVCVIDGGTNWQHEDLGANMWLNPGEVGGNSIDDDGNGYVDDVHGWNFRDNNGNPRGSAATPSNANHGSHTGGLLAGVTNNAVGMASTSWNPLLMAVNASGNADRSIAHGYEGIVYAAENGAALVSLSWGGTGASEAEQDIIDFATASGTLVVAAAGNNNSSNYFYPAAYENVLAVANVLNDGVKYGGPSGSNYGGWLDVAAPGAGTYSTFDMGVNNAYGLSTGTSMSCPVAAAVAALVKAQHPTWGPLKIGEQVRVSCENINAQNPGYIDLLGRGRVNAFRAVTISSPAVRAVDWTLADTNGDGQLNHGETVNMSLDVFNYLAPVANPSYTLSSPSPWITITDGVHAGASLLEDQGATLANAFAFTVHPQAPPQTRLDLRLQIDAAGYSDFQFIPIVLEPAFETHDINQLEVSLTGTGGVGFIGFPSGLGDEGDGFRWAGGPNVLFEGALLLGTDATHLSDAARQSGERTDFTPIVSFPPVKLTPGPSGLQEIHAGYTDSTNATTPLGVRVDLTSWASASPGHEDFVIVSFEIRNRTGAAFEALYAGLWFDWDIDEAHFSTNHTAYDASRQLGYAWDPSPGLPYTGVMALSGTSAGFSAIHNGFGVGPAGGFTKAEKWDVLQDGTGVLTQGPADISNALSTGPYRIAAGGRGLVVFALIAGSSLADLQQNADLARQFYLQSVLTDAPEVPGVRHPAAALGTPVPNPFNPTTRMQLDVRVAGDVSVGIYDARGRHVRTLADGPRAAGTYTLEWNGADERGVRMPSGVYFARLRSNDVMQARRLVLAK